MPIGTADRARASDSTCSDLEHTMQGNHRSGAAEDERREWAREKQRMEAKAKKEAAHKVEGVDGKENEEGRQVSEEAEKKRDVKVAAFLKRQEDAARKREEKLEEAALKEKEAQAKRWSGLVKTAEGPTPSCLVFVLVGAI